jgi:hypothetical protein
MKCYHCEEHGHEKKRCLEWHLEIAMLGLVQRDTPGATVAAVRDEARKVIQDAISKGKSGEDLCFRGNCLMLTWPGTAEPPYPTQGVWWCSTYYGDDG